MTLRKSALAEAQTAEKRFPYVLVLYVIAPFLLMTMVVKRPGPLSPELLAALAAVYAAVISIGALIVVQTGISIAVRQMEQAEDLAADQRSTDSALAAAINKLTEELSRRPDVSSSVVAFSVFGPTIRPAPETPSDKSGM